MSEVDTESKNLPSKLLETYGDITSAARVVGCSRATFRKHLEENKPFTKSYSKKRTVLFLPDLHCPYEDQISYDVMGNWVVKNFSLTDVVLGGDFCDFLEVCSWNKTPEMFFDEELNKCRDKLKILSRKDFPLTNITFIRGNHEDRLTRFLQSRVKDLSRLPELRVESLLGLDSLGISYQDNTNGGPLFRIGKLYFLHGHEIKAGGAVNIARPKFLKMFENMIFGHHHRSQSEIFVTASGEQKGSWSVGCMCSVNPSYNPVGSQSTQGFAVVEFDEEGDFTVHNKIICGGKVK